MNICDALALSTLYIRVTAARTPKAEYGSSITVAGLKFMTAAKCIVMWYRRNENVLQGTLYRNLY
jgi:hypothetical protein